MRAYTGETRYWTAYPADKIEAALRLHKLIDDKFFYQEFDEDADALVFQQSYLGE